MDSTVDGQLLIDFTHLWLRIQKEPGRKGALTIEFYETLIAEGQSERAQAFMILKSILDARGDMSNTPITININQSTVANLNLGKQLGDISIAVESISSQNSAASQLFAEALKAMTEAIANSTELKDKAKSEATQVLAHIASEAQKPQEQRMLGPVKTMLLGFPTIIGTVSSLTNLWVKWGPAIEGFFHHL